MSHYYTTLYYVPESDQIVEVTTCASMSGYPELPESWEVLTSFYETEDQIKDQTYTDFYHPQSDDYDDDYYEDLT